VLDYDPWLSNSMTRDAAMHLQAKPVVGEAAQSGTEGAAQRGLHRRTRRGTGPLPNCGV